MFFCRVFCCHRKELTPDVCSFTLSVVSPLITIPGISIACRCFTGSSIPLFTVLLFANITSIISGKQLHCLRLWSASVSGLILPQIAITCLPQLTLRHPVFFILGFSWSLLSAALKVKQWRSGCGHAVDVKGLFWPRLALLQSTDSLFHSTLEWLHLRTHWAQQGGGMGGSLYTRCCYGLWLNWFSVWRPFRVTSVHLCQSLNACGNLYIGPVVLDPNSSWVFLQDLGLVRDSWL